MGRWQPYLYNEQRTSVYDVPEVFNPKSVTMASYQAPPKKKKQDGPLVDFNKHPDSYLVLPYGKTDAKPMSPSVKAWIKTARWIQFVLRVLTLFGAIGVLLCAIFVRGAQATEGWITRIPVCLLILKPGGANIGIARRGYGQLSICHLSSAQSSQGTARWQFGELSFLRTRHGRWLHPSLCLHGTPVETQLQSASGDKWPLANILSNGRGDE
jgi:hypothetical protein